MLKSVRDDGCQYKVNYLNPSIVIFHACLYYMLYIVTNMLILAPTSVVKIQRPYKKVYLYHGSNQLFEITATPILAETIPSKRGKDKLVILGFLNTLNRSNNEIYHLYFRFY